MLAKITKILLLFALVLAGGNTVLNCDTAFLGEVLSEISAAEYEVSGEEESNSLVGRTSYIPERPQRSFSHSPAFWLYDDAYLDSFDEPPRV